MGTEPHSRARGLALALVCLFALAAPVASAHAAAPLTWAGEAAGPTAEGPLSLSCPSEALCVAVDGAGRALLSTNQTAAAPTWSSVTIDGGHPLAGVSCPSESLCVAIDEAGNALVSTKPAEGPWSATEIDPGHALTGISCASSTLCVAVDDAGAALSSTDPASPGSWVSHPIGVGAALLGVSCEPSGLCVALDAEGRALASADPGAPDALQPAALGPTWSVTPIDGSHPLQATSCAASGLCVALDEAGGAFAADDPTGAPPHWEGSALPVPAGVPASALSCLPGGVCVAVGAAATGGPLASFKGTVPAPVASTGAAHVTGSSKATLSGTVNPQDAVLGACVFQYGTSPSYGLSVPCATLPPSIDASGSVSATLTGLSPATVYHYRLVAIDGAGEGAGADRTLETGPPPALVYPKPTISGKPIAGHWLTCEAHLPEGAKATLSYVWLRGLTPIEGQVQRRYRPTAFDAGHHLQCQVTATNEGGSVTRTSPFVAIPIRGVLTAVGETDVVDAKLPHTRVEVAVSCSKLATEGCVIEAKLTVLETLRGHRLVAVAARAQRGRHGGKAARRRGARSTRRRLTHVAARGRGRRHARTASSSHRGGKRKHHAPKLRHLTVTIGSAHVSIEPSHDRVVKVPLNRRGRRLLRARGEGVEAQLTVTGTVVGVLKTRLRREVLTVAAHGSHARVHSH